MANPSDPRPGPGAPLPRMWKTLLEDEEEKPRLETKVKAPEPAAKPKKKRKPGEVEPTPEFETVEGRKALRTVIGVAVLAVLVITVLIFRAVNGPRPDPDAGTEEFEGTVEDVGPTKAESEARLMLAQAKSMAEGPNQAQAVGMVRRVTEEYPRTKAAREADAALARHERGRPLFLTEAEKKEELAKVKAKAEEEQGGTPAPDAIAVKKVEPPPAEVTPPPPTPLARLLPSGFQAVPGTELDPSGWPREILGERDGARMRFIPRGTFLMGDNNQAIEAPAHPVELSGFYIDIHEVTNKQYRLYAAATTERGVKAPEGDELAPVVNVSFRDAEGFAKWMGKALPTEAQWEYAARGPQSQYYINGTPPTWGSRRPAKVVGPVMAFDDDRTASGVFDLAGNAREWTRDVYDSKYYQTFLTTAARDPQGPEAPKTNVQRLSKGGAPGWHLSWREPVRVEKRLPYLGFRCVLLVEEPLTSPDDPKAPGTDAGGGGLVPF